jgi:hypothetical protein
MKLLCWLFGHVPAYGYGDAPGRGYFDVHVSVVDGVGRQHATLHCECERCGTNYQVGMIHVPTLAQIERADPYNERWDGYERNRRNPSRPRGRGTSWGRNTRGKQPPRNE